MAVEVVRFLVKKFVDSFTEEAADAEAELPFRAQFHGMRAELEKAAVSATNADELRECLYELNDLLAECRRLANRPNHQRWCFAFALSDAWRFPNTKKRVTAVRRRVLLCVEKNDSGGNAAASQQEEDAAAAAAAGLDRWTTSWLERSRIHGFDQQLAEPESMAFRDDCGAGRLNGVGIVGMGGIGKTALAQLLFSSASAKGRFFPRIWMCMSRTASAGADMRREVLQGMLMALGHKEDAILSMDGSGDSLAALVIAVHQQLMGKRFLIVFDDVWHIDGWYADVVGRQNAPRRTDVDDWSERLAFALPKERGGLVVVTSRLEQAAEAMVGKSCSYRVRPLADSESCWAIFTDALSQSQSQEKRTLDLATVNNMKQEILDTCGGLPSAAKTMGDIFAMASSSVSPPASTSTSQELGKSDHIITAR